MWSFITTSLWYHMLPLIHLCLTGLSSSTTIASMLLMVNHRTKHRPHWILYGMRTQGSFYPQQTWTQHQPDPVPSAGYPTTDGEASLPEGDGNAPTSSTNGPTLPEGVRNVPV
jgi:hypothetical protein